MEIKLEKGTYTINGIVFEELINEGSEQYDPFLVGDALYEMSTELEEQYRGCNKFLDLLDSLISFTPNKDSKELFDKVFHLNKNVISEGESMILTLKES